MSAKVRHRDLDKSCLGKVRYASRPEAMVAIHGLVKKRHRRNLHTYSCHNPKCGGWHITSKAS